MVEFAECGKPEGRFVWSKYGYATKVSPVSTKDEAVLSVCSVKICIIADVLLHILVRLFFEARWKN